MRKYLKVLGVGALLVLLPLVLGCTQAKISGTGEVPLILNQPQAKIETVQKFEFSKQVIFDYTNAFDVSEVLNEVMVGAGADAIINLRITIKTNPDDFFLNMLTCGLARARHFVVSGTAVKAPEGLSLLPGEEVDALPESAQLGDFLTFACEQSTEMGLGIVPKQNTGDEHSFKLVRYRQNP